MSVFIPTAAAGNGLCLATFGRTGELMGFFYPRIDYAQNVREGMFAIRFNDGPQAGRFLWCFDEAWNITQSFEHASNVLVTRLTHRELDLILEITDVCPAGFHALLRRVLITKGERVGAVQFMHYFRLALGDVDYRNGIQANSADNMVVQHFRDIAVAVTAGERFAAHCGSLKDPGQTHTKDAMLHGRLGSPQAIGRVDFAVGFPPVLGSRWQTSLVLAGAPSRDGAIIQARKILALGFEATVSRANDRVAAELAAAGKCPVPEIDDTFDRAVISLHDLYDESQGTFIAAPEFDLGYELSGGYGYCWPRDAAVCALAVQRIGRPDMAKRFFEWTARTQLAGGHWYQRYWVDGSVAPSWCVDADRIQLDQTCAVLHAAGQFARRLGTNAASFVDAYRPIAQRAARAVLEHIGDNRLHKPATDLWENSVGSFPYTQAAVIAALTEAEEVFGIDSGQTGPAIRAQLYDAMIATFWRADHKRWIRGISPEGHPDPTLDSSAMGLIDPWEILNLRNPQMRQIAVDTLDGIDHELRCPVKGGGAILRFQGESYMGGGPGCVNTLWLALC
ncbi:MAG TPA: glycoside hydrolase family 15 protein, partial [Phycisphaerae bacterium]|nr:glycoside hydrolase family 15 protein [Phycisphaerae bacterium]